ncbi:MAG TPA: hypothetical protein VGR55_08965 [Candidatus Acidoferrum sp.]|nr:hypothetical protein [Candidatus Acidoferrum sp.]
MRISLQILFAVMVVALYAASPAHSTTTPFSLTIATPKEPLKAGAELRLLVTITNTSNRKISFVTSPGPIPEDWILYEIDVRDEQGRSVALSSDLRGMDPRVPINYGSRTARSLAPGESFVDQVTVTRFYDLTPPGQYTISVARSMPPRQNLGNGTIKSNAMTITVAP